MSLTVEALYIYDEQDNCILEHVYGSRPPAPKAVLASLKTHPSPRPAILHLPDLSPPTIIASVTHSNTVFICPSSTDQDALALLEFIHRVIDVFEDFLGSPVLAAKIESHYDVVAQLLNEMCDGGVVCNTEPNALRENVEMATTMTKLLNQVGLPSSSGPSSRRGNLAAQLKAQSALNGPAIPWRRSNVRHTSNELYVDVLETVSVILAPSGRPIFASVSGSIVFTAKLSGVPDLLLILGAPGGSSSDHGAGISRTVQAPVFHPCVRLSRWRSNPGELSFVPPDGRFILGSYEVDLLPAAATTTTTTTKASHLFLPATIDLVTNLGPNGTDFEARLTMDTNFPGPRPASHPSRSTQPSFSFIPPTPSSSNNPTLEGVSVSIPLPPGVTSVTDLRTARGEAHFQPLAHTVVWKVPTRDVPSSGVQGATIVLTGRLAGPTVAMDTDEADPPQSPTGFRPAYDYDENEDEDHHQTKGKSQAKTPNPKPDNAELQRRNRITSALMPRSVALSFIVRGWVPSGLRVDKLEVVRGGAEGVRPFKGVKYLTVSRGGVERRV